MATKKTLAGKTRAPKARAEQPVSEDIRRAAERIGVIPSESAAPPASGSREHYEARQAEQAKLASGEATGSAEVVTLRKLARAAEQIFEFQGLSIGQLTPLEILGEALRCAQSDFSVIGDASSVGSGIVDSMVFRRAELRLDLALALAEYREEFAAANGDAS